MLVFFSAERVSTCLVKMDRMLNITPRKQHVPLSCFATYSQYVSYMYIRRTPPYVCIILYRTTPAVIFVVCDSPQFSDSRTCTLVARGHRSIYMLLTEIDRTTGALIGLRQLLSETIVFAHYVVRPRCRERLRRVPLQQ